MNNARRKLIAEAISLIMEAYGLLSEVKDDESMAYENLPESLQSSERGDTMQDNISCLEDVISTLEESQSKLEKFLTTDMLLGRSNHHYSSIIVESVWGNNGVQHGNVHIRPIPGQEPFTPDMFVECSNSMKLDYPVGTRFRIKAKITCKEGGNPFIYSHYTWPFEVLDD